MAATTPCAHCGLPAPAARPGHEDQPSFCCRGCQAVWELVHETGLDGYYAVRDQLGSGSVLGAAKATHAAEAPAYAHLDDPTLLAQVQLDGRPGTAQLHCTGLHCAACVWLIERLPLTLDGLDSARVDFGSGRVTLEWDPDQVELSGIAALLHRAGYELHALDAQAESARRDEQRRELVRLAVAGASAGNVMLVSFALYAGALSGMEPHWTRFFEVAALLLAIPAVVHGGAPFYRAAVAGLRARTLHIDLPIALGVLGGFVASVIATARGTGEVYFDSVSTLVFLLLIGRAVQRRGQQWALSQTDLMQLLLPARARRVLADGRREDCSANALRVGDRIELRAGERVAADATVVHGHASIDASSLTGESTPVGVETGDAVLAGTLAVDGGCELEVLAVGADTRIGSLAARIMEADQTRAPIQRSVDRISAWFVAAVLGLALIGGVAWWMIDPSRVFGVVVALLVISCPCALGLATPVALAVARARAARRGILLASAGALEALARAQTVVFDKTGTLTTGTLEVDAILFGPDQAQAIPAPTLAAIVLAVEHGSGHPVAQSLRRWAQSQTENSSEHVATVATNIVDELGRGRAADITLASGAHHRVRIGSLAWLEAPARRDFEAGGPFAVALTRTLDAGQTPVAIEIDGEITALLSLADSLRPDAPAALERLRELGLKLAIRSGDHPAAVAAVARSLGITDFAGAMSPEAKARSMATTPHAAMVGDGVNDAPAMRAASVGVAVRGGAEIALRTADVHLAEPGLVEVVALFEGARRTLGLIRRNLAFSLVYNLVFASLALAGLISPLAAALLMPASSLTVLLSSALTRVFAVEGPTPMVAPLTAPAPANARTQLQRLHPTGPVPPAFP